MNGFPPAPPAASPPKGASAADWQSQIRTDLG
jgi:hypothetical protein